MLTFPPFKNDYDHHAGRDVIGQAFISCVHFGENQPYATNNLLDIVATATLVG